MRLWKDGCKRADEMGDLRVVALRLCYRGGACIENARCEQPSQGTGLYGGHTGG